MTGYTRYITRHVITCLRVLGAKGGHVTPLSQAGQEPFRRATKSSPL
jgi:hypothetical protein